MATEPEPDLSARIADLQARLRADRRELDALLDAEEREPASDLLRAAFVGREAAFQALLGRLERLAGTELPALIEGPPGVGKALLARAIHEASPRRGGPLRSLDARDADPDAVGERWEAAAGGTLVARRVEQLAAPAQQRLLELLGAPEGARPRLLATAVVPEELAPGLLDRLRVLRVRLGPLSEAPHAAARLFERHVREAGAPSLEEPAAALVARSAWRGNLRQVERVARAAAAAAKGGAVEVAHVEAALEGEANHRDGVRLDPSDGRTLEAIERAAIAARLRQLGWAQQRTAESLGIDRKTLYRKIRRYGLEPPAQDG